MKEETRFGCMDKDITITDDYGEMIEVVTTSGINPITFQRRV